MNIQSLSAPERILLAEELWDSVRVESEGLQLTDEQIELLDSRLAALEADGVVGDSWENVRSRVVGKG